jgi:uncharacterized lipoprotein
MTMRAMRFLSLAALLPLAGCGLLPDAYTGCDEARPYQTAKEMGPLRVPAGADLPDTKNALKIPDVKAPDIPLEAGTCLEHPPPFGKDRPQPKAD